MDCSHSFQSSTPTQPCQPWCEMVLARTIRKNDSSEILGFHIRRQPNQLLLTINVNAFQHHRVSPLTEQVQPLFHAHCDCLKSTVWVIQCQQGHTNSFTSKFEILLTVQKSFVLIQSPYCHVTKFDILFSNLATLLWLLHLSREGNDREPPEITHMFTLKH
jgi:hypothetical protein